MESVQSQVAQGIGLDDMVQMKFAWRSNGGPIPGNVQSQAGQHSEQPGLIKDIPAHYGDVGLDDL